MLSDIYQHIISTSQYIEAFKPLLLRRIGVGPHLKAGLATMGKGQEGRCPHLLQSGGRGFSIFTHKLFRRAKIY